MLVTISMSVAMCVSDRWFACSFTSSEPCLSLPYLSFRYMITGFMKNDIQQQNNI